MRPPRPFRVPIALAAAFALIAGCAGEPTAPAPEADVAIVPGAVAQGSAGFTPNPLVRTLADGARVTWLNQDYQVSARGASSGTRHRLISEDGLFDSGDVEPGAAFAFDFAQPGTYRYRCLNHPTMTGTVTIDP